jgi:GntR family transcriptional regulator
MYVTEGASEKLLASERERFLREEWPAMLERIRQLGLSLEQLMREPGEPGEPQGARA